MSMPENIATTGAKHKDSPLHPMQRLSILKLVNRMHFPSAIFYGCLGALLALAYTEYGTPDYSALPAAAPPNLVPTISVTFNDTLSSEQYQAFTHALQTATVEVQWVQAEGVQDAGVDWSECKGDGCGALFPGGD